MPATSSRTWSRPRLAGATALGLTILMSGCVVFQGPIRAKQIGQKPKVAVSFKLCNSHPGPSNCPDLGNSDDGGTPSGILSVERVLLGFRVPNGTRLPARIGGRSAAVTGAFERFARYSRELTQELPPKPGYRWLGYAAYPGGDDAGEDSGRYEDARFRVVMKLPRRFEDGAFKLRPVVGFWRPTKEEPQLNCGPDPFEPKVDGDGTRTICIDDPTRSVTRSSIRVEID